ncbi:MAG: flagellar basal body rod protein FlgC [Planktomarina sp.]|jgi:flagellar basal-body rod protein FlgC|nr:flagellar basal body rod protein FlgC [Planktomarina sp.]MDA9238033.1 flagellar basal body rod protein FlgC [Planktomarina sp.]MDC0633896.1 flagellar basal body rod protein FlgC [Planktomarina sp.]MDC1249383.1 flagellar basal body rod protein FlgC [Planktomarina sp.]|tara:strand:- start:426 stop:842 length:417 start_codon:yes stop_codon:yes gene_type:complete
MSDIKNIFDIAARGMSSQMVRLNTVASNLANSRTVASSDAEAYKAIKAVFKTVYADDVQRTGVSSVDVDEIVEVDRPAEKSFQPGHPKADKDGFIYTAAVNVEEEMVEMLEASRQYENNVEMVSTLRGLMMRTINMGK